MAALFGDYSFAAASRRPVCDQTHKADDDDDYDCERAAPNSMSPTSVMLSSLPARLTTPPPDMGDLVHALDRQTLRITLDTSFLSNQQTSHHHEPLTPPSDDVAFPMAASPTHSTARLYSATLRMQRQANVRMQCERSHVKDIKQLVEKMVDTGDQCNICERATSSLSSSSMSLSPAASDEDEGIDMDYTPTVKEQLHSLAPSHRGGGGSARISKRPRMRKPRSSKPSSQ